MRFFTAAIFSLFIMGSFSTAKAASEKKAEGSGGFEYVELSPLMLPIVDESGVSQIINLVIALEVADLAAADKVKQLKPKLTDAFIMDMYGVLNSQASMRGGVLQIGLIKERLNRVSDEVMGDHDSVNDVLLQVVQQRPI